MTKRSRALLEEVSEELTDLISKMAVDPLRTHLKSIAETIDTHLIETEGEDDDLIVDEYNGEPDDEDEDDDDLRYELDEYDDEDEVEVA